jgi:trigger factor
MDVSTETLSPTRVKLTVTVPFTELQPSINKAYKKLGSQVRVPGFRPGKVPSSVIDQRVGRPAVLAEALDDAVGEFYSQAAQDAKIVPLATPQVDLQGFGDGEPLVFTAEVDVRPEITLPPYEGLKVTVGSAALTETEIQENLTALVERQASLEVVERPVQTGDVVRVDLTTTVDGETIDGATTEGIAHEVGSGALIPGLDDALVGASTGETRTFDTEMVAGDHAGKTASVQATVRQVESKTVPELNDAFVAEHTSFSDVAALKDDLVTRLTRVKTLQQGVDARDKVLEQLMEITEVPLPESVVHGYAHERIHEMEQQLSQMGFDLEKYLELQGEDPTAWHEAQHVEAGKAVKAQLVLDAVADKEELSVTQEELTDQLVRRALRSGIDPNTYAEQLVQAGAVPQLAADVRRGKALAVVLEAAEVTDDAGEPVDLTALRDDLSDGTD